MRLHANCFLATLLSIAVLEAADNLPKTLMTERGKLLYSEDFTSLDTKNWRAAKGKWEIAHGGLKGVELAADKHGAVIRHQLAFKDAVIQFDVQVNGSKQTTFSVNEAKAHLARVLFTKLGFAAQKDDRDHAGPDKAVRFATVALPLKPGEWHTVLVEFKGNEMVATMGGKTIAGANEAFLTPKANFGFTVAGDSACYRNLRVWEALPNPSWAENKKQISSTTK